MTIIRGSSVQATTITPPGYIWVADFSRKHNLDRVTVIRYCSMGWIDGAKLLANGRWYIPVDTRFEPNPEYITHRSKRKRYLIGKAMRNQ